MSRSAAFAAIALLLAAASSGPSRCETAPSRGERLAAAIEERLRDKLYANVDVGIRIVTLDGRETLYELEPDAAHIPASAAKIFPSAVSLIRFGSDHRIETPLKAVGEPRDGVLEGDLYLVGRGDPALEASHLDEAAAELAGGGLRAIRGALVYDVSYLEVRGPLHPPNARHLYAPPSALTVGSNWIVLELDDGPPPRLTPRPETSYAKLDYDIRVEDSDRPGRPEMTFRQRPWGDEYTIRGTVTRWDKRYEYLRLGVSRPGLYAATLVKEALARRGIEVGGGLREGRAPADARTLAVIRTAPLVRSIRILNQESNNVVAELVTQDLGAAFDSLPGTRGKGLAVIRAYLTREVGFGADAFRLADASGLSVDNCFSAAQLTRALNHFHERLGTTFVDTLARQGHHPHASAVVPPPEIRMYVKSGTLPATGVNTLVGYVFLDRTDEAFSFALLARRRGGGAPLYSGTLTNPLLRTLVDALN